MKEYSRLLRIKHWIKNCLVFSALLFSGRLFHIDDFYRTFLGAAAFSLLSSAIYIINDIKDIGADRRHEIKCKRPIASGKIPVRRAIIIGAAAFTAALLINQSAVGNRFICTIWLLIYFLLNLLYSFGLKQYPILDIAILASGFLIRVFYGAAIIDQQVSSWLYLTVISMSFYLCLGKRRNELIKTGADAENVRGVLKFYNHNFLDKNMYMFLALTIAFYSLWTVDTVERLSNSALIWTVPLVMIICMRYSLCIESSSYADPVEVLTGDKVLILTVAIYAVVIAGILYGAFI